jgi:hypothetical protein
MTVLLIIAVVATCVVGSCMCWVCILSCGDGEICGDEDSVYENKSESEVNSPL